MLPRNPLLMLSALGALQAATGAAAADTSAWRCETCPYEKPGLSGEVEAGLGSVSGQRARYGDYTGLNDKTGFLVAGGALRWRDGSGLFGSADAADLGLDARRLAADLGREGLFDLHFGYATVPHRLADAGLTPFITNGSTLTLPAGYPAASTAQMPLGSTLQPVTLGTQRSRYDLGARWIAGERWTHRISLRHEVRDGTRITGASFFSTASQLAAPVDEVTDQIEIASTYTGRRWQGTVAYQASMFRNQNDAVSWSNPFNAVAPGATLGRIAQAPDNQFHQVLAQAGFELAPRVRASFELAAGRMTQDAAFLSATTHATLAATLPALPQTSLQGRVDTFDGSLNLSATVLDGLRFTASVARHVRDNRTPTALYPAVATDLFVDPTARASAAFSFRQTRARVGADLRASQRLDLSVGADWDERSRTYQDVVQTREGTLWARGTLRATDALSLALKVSHADRTHSTYGLATWPTSVQNPLLRKVNLADRSRDMASLRADITVSEKLAIGLHLEHADDHYTDATLGLRSARSLQAGADASYALSEATQFTAYAYGEQARASQHGSEAYAGPDWTGTVRDSASVFGLGARHVALKGKLELRGDIAASRSRSRTEVLAASGAAPFPDNRTGRDSLQLRATFEMKDGLWLVGRYAYEHQSGDDWHLDGVAPGSVYNLLAIGQQPPRYSVNVLSVALRYRF